MDTFWDSHTARDIQWRQRWLRTRQLQIVGEPEQKARRGSRYRIAEAQRDLTGQLRDRSQDPLAGPVALNVAFYTNRNAEDKQYALDAVRAFDAAYGAKFPKAAAKITDDVEELLAFYDYPVEHWIHLRTTNPIESTFVTVRHRTKVTRGAGLAGGRAGDGVQADQVGPGPLARGERTPPGRVGPRRSRLRQRRPG